jgi:hypothetical protein
VPLPCDSRKCQEPCDGRWLVDGRVKGANLFCNLMVYWIRGNKKMLNLKVGLFGKLGSHFGTGNPRPITESRAPYSRAILVLIIVFVITVLALIVLIVLLLLVMAMIVRIILLLLVLALIVLIILFLLVLALIVLIIPVLLIRTKKLWPEQRPCPMLIATA